MATFSSSSSSAHLTSSVPRGRHLPKPSLEWRRYFVWSFLFCSSDARGIYQHSYAELYYYGAATKMADLFLSILFEFIFCSSSNICRGIYRRSWSMQNRPICSHYTVTTEATLYIAVSISRHLTLLLPASRRTRSGCTRRQCPHWRGRDASTAFEPRRHIFRRAGAG